MMALLSGLLRSTFKRSPPTFLFLDSEFLGRGLSVDKGPTEKAVIHLTLRHLKFIFSDVVSGPMLSLLFQTEELSPFYAHHGDSRYSQSYF